jgi:hypothetical protein
VVVNQVPVVLGSGRPFFATGALAEPPRLENPTTIAPGDGSPTWYTTSAAGERLNSDECAALLQSFIAAHPEVWGEHIGE